MPTGYTSAIKDGITFQEYALGCARAFGALISMREEPSDAPIPDAFEISPYYQQSYDEARKEFEEFSALEYEVVAEKYEEYFAKAVASYEKTKLEKQDLEVKYLRMLADVKEYAVPSYEHREFKKFMEDQIVQSIAWDCDMKYYPVPQRVDVLDWWQDKLLMLKRNVEHASQNLQEEIERVEKRNLWIKQLKESLK